RFDDRLIVLSYDFWRKHFSSDSMVVGRGISLGDASFTVVGVMPPRFRFPQAVTADAWRVTAPDVSGISAVVRLRAGVKIEQARGLLRHVDETEKNAPDIRIESLSSDFVGWLAPVFVALLCAVGLLCLIACANVASLFLSR